MDVYRRETVEHSFGHYLLFVSFFPQLIAGPIVHHKEIMPQFVAGRAGRILPANFALGLSAATITCMLFMSCGGTFLYFQL